MEKKTKVGTESFCLTKRQECAVSFSVGAVYELCHAYNIPCLCVVQTENRGFLGPHAFYHYGKWIHKQREDTIMSLLQYLHGELLKHPVITWELAKQLKADIHKRLKTLDEPVKKKRKR